MFAAPFSLPSSRPSRSFPPRNDSLIYPISVSLVKKQVNGYHGLNPSYDPSAPILQYFITPTLQSLSLCDIGRKFQSRRKILWQLLSVNPLKICSAQNLSPSSAPRKRAHGRWESIEI